MIPELHISKVRSGVYEARVLDGSEEIFESTLHESIAAAIRDVAQDFPNKLSEFLEVRYIDVSIGTQYLGKMRVESAAMAESLVQLAAAVWAAEEERVAPTLSSSLRIDLFQDSQQSFLEALEAAGLEYVHQVRGPGIYASGLAITLVTYGLPALAAVLTAWLAPRPSRKIQITLKDRSVVSVEGNSVKEIQTLLREAERVAAIDTRPMENRTASEPPSAVGLGSADREAY